MKKIIVAIAVVLASIILGISIVLLNAKNLIYWYLRPDHHFDVARTPSAPDYSNERNWAALPTRKNEANLVPPGSKTCRRDDAGADVFYIHPTGYYSAENWNSIVDPDA